MYAGDMYNVKRRLTSRLNHATDFRRGWSAVNATDEQMLLAVKGNNQWYGPGPLLANNAH